MSLLELEGVGRFYRTDKEHQKYVLKGVTLSFSQRGLVSIVGKSGCGKTTLLNLIGKIDNPSEGNIFFNGKNLSKYSESELAVYRNKVVSYVFQHYHLLENQTALYNIMLPVLLSGESFKKAKKKVLSLIGDFQIDKEILSRKCSLLSGGEKERIAVLRAFINQPKIILADEPTGALDKENALLVMKALKKASRESLVIMVTHNTELAFQYSDRIIEMKDGRIIKDEKKNTFLREEKIIIKKSRSNPNWYSRIIFTNFQRRFKRNLFSIFSLVVGITASLLIFGFANGADKSISKTAIKQFDYGVASLSKENKIISPNSPINLIQTMRASEVEINELQKTHDFCHFCYSYETLIGPTTNIKINEAIIENVSYLPIYSFVDCSIDKTLLIKGKIPLFDTLNQVLINKKAYDYLKKELKCSPVNTFLVVESNNSFTYYTDDSIKPYIIDYFVFNRLVEIVGVVDEISFLNTPKVYYSYKALDRYMEQTLLNNLSVYQGETSWKDRVSNAADNEFISHYSHLLFLKNSSDVYRLKQFKKEIDEKFSIASNAITVEETLFSLVEVSRMGMEMFLAIALVGTAMIVGIISYASYSEDIKDSAILLCLGAKRKDIASIYIFESMMLGFISLIISFCVATLLIKPFNLLIQNFTSLIDVIDIPFMIFKGRTLLFPSLIVIVTTLICIVATYLPIVFSKKISLSEELKAND
ncbi:MAG TPA: ABC transporter ATP-binding protein/permease [Erysipelotrichaceae bacterium]|nr:ABC transporter ATP-binding protein/permease [Erysipelotrichaceae bacterium]